MDYPGGHKRSFSYHQPSQVSLSNQVWMKDADILELENEGGLRYSFLGRAVSAQQSLLLGTALLIAVYLHLCYLRATLASPQRVASFT